MSTQPRLAPTGSWHFETLAACSSPQPTGYRRRIAVAAARASPTLRAGDEASSPPRETKALRYMTASVICGSVLVYEGGLRAGFRVDPFPQFVLDRLEDLERPAGGRAFILLALVAIPVAEFDDGRLFATATVVVPDDQRALGVDLGRLADLHAAARDDELTRGEVVHRGDLAIRLERIEPVGDVRKQRRDIFQAGKLPVLAEPNRRREAIERDERLLEVFLEFRLA
jgi:hypothetical protein